MTHASAKARKPISTRTRFEVFKRDGFVCQYCGSHPPLCILHVDHIVPVKEGGKNEMGNFATACDQCNRGKAAVPLEVISPSLASQAAIVAEREAQLRGYNDIMEMRQDRIESQAWKVVHAFEPDAKTYRTDWLRSIKGFNENLGLYEVLDAVEITRSKGFRRDGQIFRYFCGVCWRKINEASKS